MAVWDAIVIGLGVMGSAALAELAGRGQRVLGIEQFYPQHSFGSSHGETRIIRQAYFEDPSYVPLVQRSYEGWQALAHDTGQDLFLRTGGLMAGKADSAVVLGSLRSAREHGLAHELLDARDIQRRFPAFRPLPEEQAVYEPDAGVLFAERCTAALLQRAVRNGAAAWFGVKVGDWNPARGRSTTISVDTSGGREWARSLVITAGPWLGGIMQELRYPLTVERQTVHWWQPANPAPFQPDVSPLWILERDSQPALYGFPYLTGQGVKAAVHHGGALVDPDTVDRQVAAGEVTAVAERLRSWIPDAAGHHLRSNVCLYTNTPDEHFLIGQFPRLTNVAFAGGFSGHGFKFAPVVGKVLADLVLSGSSDHPIASFSPARFGSRRARDL